jgi:hypothetical protein
MYLWKNYFISFYVNWLAFSTQAQEISKNAIGLRLGDSGGFGTEITYQRALGSNNRLELDLGWRNRNDYKNNGYDDNAIKLAVCTNGYGTLMVVSTGMLV